MTKNQPAILAALVRNIQSAIACGLLAWPVFSTGAAGQTKQSVVVSCFRGPLKEVIWDRPEPIFVDTLVKQGFSYSTALSIAERVCRDPELVGNSNRLIEVTTQILRTTKRDNPSTP